ncbi:MAG: hypothetical protein RR997_02720, partial [Raoultibacter sp.]
DAKTRQFAASTHLLRWVHPGIAEQGFSFQPDGALWWTISPSNLSKLSHAYEDTLSSYFSAFQGYSPHHRTPVVYFVEGSWQRVGGWVTV